MIKFEMEKLVRDKIPQIIEGQGGMITRRTLGEEEFFRELQIKLTEETTELSEVKLCDKGELINELADVQLILDYLVKTSGASDEELRQAIEVKSKKVGDFENRTYIGTVKLPDDSEWVKYYRKKGFKEIR
ncbi:MAG: nucleoside triphosphate pyrophosphohydrolase [Candidatus Shapirobacteria bacterium]|nr:nucleoside triphosphate pyrophosphohydrolase [Candidatus Shapirobacteria bacterium]